MELNELRSQINEIDLQMQELFTKRMAVAQQVADFKIGKGMPVFQPEREAEILERVSASAPEGLENATRIYFQTLMDISKCKQFEKVYALYDKSKQIKYNKLDLSGKKTVAVPGTVGSYNHLACSNLFEDFEPVFHENFEDIFVAVENGETEFGILPIVNSTAGSVAQTYELLRAHDLYICAETKLRVSHCLAVKNGVKLEDIKEIYSHEQGLQQCSDMIKKYGFKTHRYSNTSLAACYIKQSDKPYGAICSKACADELGLDIILSDVQNATDNYTKFILVSKEILKAEKANTISVCLSLPHQASALYRLLTKFSVAGLNLSMIENMPIANTDFNVVFYLDFSGDIDTPEVLKLMCELETELAYFKFLGNYEEV